MVSESSDEVIELLRNNEMKIEPRQDSAKDERHRLLYLPFKLILPSLPLVTRCTRATATRTSSILRNVLSDISDW